MKTYSVQHARNHLSKLIQKALNGEDVVITSRQKPVVKLVAFQHSKRRLGFLGTKVWMSSDFNAPLENF